MLTRRETIFERASEADLSDYIGTVAKLKKVTKDSQNGTSRN
jgi:hypothetical protein